jgi:hypothetical protein
LAADNGQRKKTKGDEQRMNEPAAAITAENHRLEQSRRRTAHWKRWGPYVSERAWGTVREDYSADGSAWNCVPHDHARSRTYRWNEDGLAGICDRHQRICLAIALWNGKDPILKERLFGLTGNEGNHGEDVKEYYFYLDSTPTHSYMRMLYKYPQSEYPYARLVDENRRRGKGDPEFELIDTGIFDADRYFDVFVEYAKATPEDILMRVTVSNRGPEPAEIHVLPTLWFRNRWAWGRNLDAKPDVQFLEARDGHVVFDVEETYYGKRKLYFEGSPEPLFTDNETNTLRLFGTPNTSHYVKDGFHECVLKGDDAAVNPERRGTKAAAWYRLNVPPGGEATVCARFADTDFAERNTGPFGDDFERVFRDRRHEADEFYATVIPTEMSDDGRNVMRQSIGGLLWSKQYYRYTVAHWLEGDPSMPRPPASRWHGRNADWTHIVNADVISMPDKWEYPWYAAWDLAFHCVPIALVDPDFAKEQLILLLREWYMHPNGQLPAYEWALGDVNPPVHAWAALRVYAIERKRTGVGDRYFLQRVFHKLLLNFTWWVNRKDAEGNNIFEGGFLGLDNIGVYDRSTELAGGGNVEQADGTSWMAMFTLNMLAIALELAREDPAYEDVATKFFEHFVFIGHATNNISTDNLGLWDEEDGFYYDVLRLDRLHVPFRVRSMVGLIPLFACETLETDLLERLPGFRARMDWFLTNRPELTQQVSSIMKLGTGRRLLFSLANEERLERILTLMLDEREFLSPYGIRSLSRCYDERPYTFECGGVQHQVEYEPAESRTGIFGGNSNWRGPVWFPVNYLLIEALQKYHYYFGDELTVEFPTGSGNRLHLGDVAAELSRRLSRLFLRDESGRRPVNGAVERFQTDPHWRDHVLFFEYFHGDTGAGLGASHQTGWTGLVAKLLQQSGE